MLKRIRTFINKSLIITTAIFSVVVFYACKNPIPSEKDEALENCPFSVEFLSASKGDCILINLPDGKTMIIDTGEENSVLAEEIIKRISNKDKNKIDYLILSHPDQDHIGNVDKIVEKFSIGTAFLPYVKNTSLFPVYSNAREKILQVADKVLISEIGRYVLTEDYFFCFLWPKPAILGGYDGINIPTVNQNAINKCSSVIYLECFDKRFLFTGDIDSGSALEILNNYNANLYDFSNINKKVNLKDIDFYKVPHHGSYDGVNKKFLSEVSPKNAIISVGAGNIYNHPSSQTLTMLQTINPNVNIYRTDVMGNILINFNKNKEYIIKTQLEKPL